MNSKTTTKIATIVLLVLALTTTIASADYPMFGLDPQRTGNASGDAPLANMRLWETKLGEKSYIGGGASVVGDQVYVTNWPTMPPVIYAGLGLYCLDKSDGSVIWNTSIGEDGGVS
ncbi:MAG: hypothetical protein GQ567_01595, partial [Methanosarcinales archaeon]|nr:hypothetical protein [Methanosarcinales archaeon]